MSVIEMIFWDYLDRSFRVKPDSSVDRGNSARLREFEESFAMSDEQAERFEQFLFGICCDYQRTAFSDGFKLAFVLMFEAVG